MVDGGGGEELVDGGLAQALVEADAVEDLRAEGEQRAGR
jgi:hypothetical protein